MIEWIRRQSLRMAQEMDPGHSYGILEAMRRGGVFDRELVDVLVERMSDEVDRFSTHDIVEGFKVLADLGLARGFLLRRMAQISFENLHVFMPKQLCHLISSLGKLRFLVRSNVDGIIDELLPALNEGRLRAADLSRLAFGLAMLSPEYDDYHIVQQVMEQFLEKSKTEMVYLVHLVDAGWAACRYKHIFGDKENPVRQVPEGFSSETSGESEEEGEKKKPDAPLTALFRRLFSQSVTKNRVLLLKTHEIGLSLRL